MNVAAELLICHDCACVIANGECVVLTSDGYEDIAAGLIAMWETNGWSPMSLVLACGPDESACPDYSTALCDACGSDEAGWRHVAASIDTGRERR